MPLRIELRINIIFLNSGDWSNNWGINETVLLPVDLRMRPGAEAWPTFLQLAWFFALCIQIYHYERQQ
jgi:hypothetical protein